VVIYDPSDRPPADPRRLAHQLGATEVLDALALRSVVEPGGAELAAGRQLDKLEAGRLRAALARVDTAEGPARRVEDSRLHILIAELSGSSSVAATVAEVQGRLDELLAAIPVFARNIRHSDDQHRRIARAILRSDPAAARAAMAEHVAGTAALLRGLLT
jgi:DNA-binding FadR family transcriptional regulator